MRVNALPKTAPTQARSLSSLLSGTALAGGLADEPLVRKPHEKAPPPMLLKPKGPFNLAHTIGSGQAFRWQPHDGWYYGVVVGDVWKVRQAGREIELHSALQPDTEAAALARSYFRLDDDLAGIYRHIGEDRRVAGAVRRFRGMRLVRQEPWECLVTFVISAYSNIPRITRHVERICELWGDPVSLDGHHRHTFPSPSRLAEVGEPEFRDIGLGYRAPFLARLAPSLLKWDLELADLRSAPYPEAKAELLKLDGVGEKVADCVLLFSLDKLEAFPVDVHIRHELLEWYFPGDKRTDRQLRLWAAEHFGPLAGYAQQYLFHGRRLEGQAARSRPAKLRGK